MKIFACEVRKDELAAFAEAAAAYQVELTAGSLVPTVKNEGLVSGCSGVIILGQGRIDRSLLEICRSLGVRYLSARTIGSNHIDFDAATPPHHQSIELPSPR